MGPPPVSPRRHDASYVRCIARLLLRAALLLSAAIANIISNYEGARRSKLAGTVFIRKQSARDWGRVRSLYANSNQDSKSLSCIYTISKPVADLKSREG
jgi:hypothetical protein